VYWTTTFSDINDPNATFTGKPGTYSEVDCKWMCKQCPVILIVVIKLILTVNDYITFKDNYDRTGPFSIEMWVKAGDRGHRLYYLNVMLII
jgi:hypothetical protein